MRRSAFVLVCLACLGHGRQVHAASGRSQETGPIAPAPAPEAEDEADRRGANAPMQTFAQMLSNYKPAAAFSPAGPGFASVRPRSSSELAKHCLQQAKQYASRSADATAPWTSLRRVAHCIQMAIGEPDCTKSDYYERLGVKKGAAMSEIRKGFGKATQKYHPDVNPGSKTAEDDMTRINQAYNILKDKNTKELYDKYGEEGIKNGQGARRPGGGYAPSAPPGFGGMGGMGGPGMGGGFQEVDIGDIFDTFFGGSMRDGGSPGGGFRSSGPKQGDDLRFDLEIDFNTAVFGGSKKIRINKLKGCQTCESTGVAPGAKVTKCNECGGRGVTVQTVQTILGTMQQQGRCPKCQGEGTVVEKYCGKCDGRGVVRGPLEQTVTIPPGVQDNNRLRVRGMGDAGPKGGPAGDLYVFVSVKPDPNFRRDGMDIFSEITISYLDAILGTTLKVPVVDGEVELKIPAGTQPGDTKRIEGKGAPKLNGGGVRGTHHVKINVEIPRSISSEQRELITKLKETK